MDWFCIGSIGLPFLTGIRRGGLPQVRPSVNLALYRAGRCVLYLLQEHRAEALLALSETGAARIGRSRVEVGQQERQLKLRVTLDESVSGHASRLRANIELNGITRVQRMDSRARDWAGAPVGFGIYEFVQPGRIDLPWQRPFVRMRTHRVGDENSALLPLFSGWEMGRERRWLNTFRQRWVPLGTPLDSRPDPLWSDFARKPDTDRYHGMATHESVTTLDTVEGKHEFE